MNNFFQIEEDIIAFLKELFPEYTKNILPLFSDDEISNRANFSPAIYVVTLDSAPLEVLPNTHISQKDEQLIGILMVFRDARDNVFNHKLAGEVLYKIRKNLQGKKFDNYTPMQFYRRPRQYPIGRNEKEQSGAVCYPLLFKNSFVISGN